MKQGTGRAFAQNGVQPARVGGMASRRYALTRGANNFNRVVSEQHARW